MTAKPTITPLKLAPVAAACVRLTNAVTLRALPSRLPWGRSFLSLRLLAAVPRFEAALVCTVSVNGARWTLAFSSIKELRAHALFAQPEARDAALEVLPAELLEAVAEALIQPITDALGAALGATIVIEDVRLGGAGPIDAALGFALEPDDGACFLATVLPENDAAGTAMAALLSGKPRLQSGMLARLADDIPLRLAFCAGRLALDEAAFTDLAVGDVLLPDLWLAGSGTLEATVATAGHYGVWAQCTFSGNVAKITTLTNSPSETAMSTAEELPVKLTFELENRTITVGELKSLAPGYTFTLTADASSPVTVLANGKPVAKARLVDVNGAIGVQLTETL